MRVLVLHTPKGGSGKSTLARELAVAAARTGQKTALVDMDPQGTTTGWYKRRAASEPALVKLPPGASLEALDQAGAELVVVDTPPGAPAFLPTLLAAADAVLVPVRPTPDDLLAAAAIARSLARCPAWAFVLCQVPTRTRFLGGAVRQLAALGKVAPATVGFRVDYPAAAIEGQAAVEFDGKAAEESASLWTYTAQLLEVNVDGEQTKR